MTRAWLKWAISLGVFACIIGLSIPAINLLALAYKPMPIDPANPPVIVLNKASSAQSFARDLKAKHLISSDVLFLKLIRLQAFTSKLKAGVYQLHVGESAQQFLRRVVSGDVLIESFRIISGTTSRQVSDNLEQAPYLNYNRADWLLVADTRLNAEGLLLADTYHYDAGSQSKDLMMHAARNLQQYLDTIWQTRDSDLPYKTAYELLIAASILEKEAALLSEKYLISGVIINRLRLHMRLQMDPTVIYALGDEYTGKLTHDDLQVDSPYNTYRYGGLPPTPIAMVGKEAILAAAHPARTDYLYFVAKGDGSHQFSKTYDQQKKAIVQSATYKRNH